MSERGYFVYYVILGGIAGQCVEPSITILVFCGSPIMVVTMLMVAIGYIPMAVDMYVCYVGDRSHGLYAGFHNSFGPWCPCVTLMALAAVRRVLMFGGACSLESRS